MINQIKITNAGYVFLSQDVGADNLNDIKFRLETYDAGNDYVGLEASLDLIHIQQTYQAIKDAWNNDFKGYLDTY